MRNTTLNNHGRNGAGLLHFGRPARGLAVFAGACALLLAPQLIRAANAQENFPVAVAAVEHQAAAKPAAKVAKPYFIEFRSRSAQSYGHTFSIYGRLNGQGRIASFTVAGLHPFTESPIPWMVGHLVLVPSETGASDGDREDQYVTARFRVNLSEAEYQKVTGYIKKLQAQHPVWHAVLYNCNAFVGDIARFMGFNTPGSTMLMPEDYVSQLREMNINRRDASIIGTPTRVEDANALRAAAIKAGKKANRPEADAATGAAPSTPRAAKPRTHTSRAPASAPAAATPASASPAPAAAPTSSATPPAATAPRAQAPATRSTALTGYASAGTSAQGTPPAATPSQ